VIELGGGGEELGGDREVDGARSDASIGVPGDDADVREADEDDDEDEEDDDDDDDAVDCNDGGGRKG